MRIYQQKKLFLFWADFSRQSWSLILIKIELTVYKYLLNNLIRIGSVHHKTKFLTQENDMKKISLFILSFFMLLSASPALGQSTQDEIGQSSRQFEEWTKSLSEFVKDVRFNEEDVQSLISQWDDFNAIGEEKDGDEGEFVDFDSILNDSDYRSWAKSKDLNSETWLKKTMRITAMIMRTQIEAGKSEGQFDMKAQLAELEEMRAQMGEETYQQVKQAMEASAAAMQGVDNSYKYLPVPTDSEKILLAKYNNQLMNLE